VPGRRRRFRSQACTLVAALTDQAAFANRAELERSFARSEPAVAAQPKPARRTQAKPLDVVKEARKRLRCVTRELKQARKAVTQLEREQGQLSRLLDAADGKTKPTNVRSLRASGQE
jgi:small-conductance mechanosensitive channel